MPPSRERARWSTTKWIAAILAIAVHLAFVLVLVFSVNWQNRKPEPVTAELYAPPPEKTEPAKPEPPKPPQTVAPPKPDIALKEKQERLKKEQAERERKEKQETEKRETE